jgi:hypothetical protein
MRCESITQVHTSQSSRKHNKSSWVCMMIDTTYYTSVVTMVWSAANMMYSQDLENNKCVKIECKNE